MKLADETSQTTLNVLAYGDSGTGKTTLGVSAPSPLILLSETQGMASIKQAAKRQGLPVPRVVIVEEWGDYLTIWETLMKSAGSETVNIAGVEMAYPETVVIDSLTDAGNLLWEEIDKIAPPADGKDGLPARGMRSWGAAKDRFEKMLLCYRDLPTHVLFLALRDDKDADEESGKSRSTNPMLPVRSLASRVAAAVNLIAVTTRSSKKSRDPSKKGSYDTIYEVKTVGPEYMLTKEYEPLKHTEAPDFSDWVRRVREAHDE